MPKHDDEKPAEVTNPATAAHLADAPDDEKKPAAARPRATAKPDDDDDDEKPDPKPKATAAHTPPKPNDPPVPMDPDVEAKRSGPPPGSDLMPDVEATLDAPPADRPEDDAERPVIEDLLRDPTFDPGGRVRLQLAAISMRDGVGQRAPAHLVDADGKAMAQR